MAKTLPPTFHTCEPPHWTSCVVARSLRQKVLYSRMFMVERSVLDICPSRSSSTLASLYQPHRLVQCIAQGGRIGLALSCNIECDAVIDRSAHEGQSDGDIHPLLDAEILDRDQA